MSVDVPTECHLSIPVDIFRARALRLLAHVEVQAQEAVIFLSPFQLHLGVQYIAVANRHSARSNRKQLLSPVRRATCIWRRAEHYRRMQLLSRVFLRTAELYVKPAHDSLQRLLCCRSLCRLAHCRVFVITVYSCRHADLHRDVRLDHLDVGHRAGVEVELEHRRADTRELRRIHLRPLARLEAVLRLLRVVRSAQTGQVHVVLRLNVA
mmetsp:Transcript_8365/g.21514  ORF Transcript_8365/g.21514 Transcript_8365/m.21514 type:complete len:209 (+) Transcript_8365:75-701(+)